MHLLRSLSIVLLLAAAASAQQVPLPKPQDGVSQNQGPQISNERPMMLSELAAGLQRSVASKPELANLARQVASAVQAAPQAGAAPIVLSGQQRQELAGLVQAALEGNQGALQQLNRFPGWTIPHLGQVLRTELAAGPLSPRPEPRPGSISEELGIPVANQTPPKTTLRPLGQGVFRGDVYDSEKAKRYPDSARLAEVMNRLSLNGTGWVVYKGKSARSPRGLLELLVADGHSVETKDHRSIANFSGLYYRGEGESTYREVVAPLWLDTRVPVPGKDRTLLVPATHSELVVTVRGPVVNADLAFYFGIDHQATFRATAWRRPSWTGSRSIRTFSGQEALRSVSAAAWVRRNMTRLNQARGLMTLRSKAYGQIGVCNDATALIEGRMGLKASHWPLVRLPEVYRDAGQLTEVSDALPYDTNLDVLPERDRVIDSVPFEAGEVPELFPTLAEDLEAIAADDAAQAAQKPKQTKPLEQVKDDAPEGEGAAQKLDDEARGN